MLPKKLIAAFSIFALSTTALSPVEAQQSGGILGALGRAIGGGDNENDQQETQAQPQRGGPSAGTVAGTAACAGAGVLLGRLIFGRNSTAGQVIGGLVGGAFCFSILSKKDNEALKRRSAELMNQRGSSSTTWKAPESGAEVTIETRAEELRQQKTEFSYESGLAKPANNTILDAQTYVVTVDRLNFRSAPNTTDQTNIIGYFSRDDNIEVVGYTPDRRWAIVGNSNHVIIGYAAMSDGSIQTLATPEDAAQLRERQAVEAASRARNAKARKEALAAAQRREAARTQGRATPLAANGTALAPRSVVTAKVVAAVPCKAQVARTGDQSLSRTGCKGTDGSFRFS